jgi:hypothetical protein
VLTVVEVQNVLGSTLRLPLLDTSKGYSVREIDGLGPVAASLTSSSLAQVDGAQAQNARRDIRNITMKLGFVPDFVNTTVQSLRSVLYDYFMTKAIVNLNFYVDDILTMVTSGQVETFDNPLFTPDPEADISIVCYDPDFYGPAPLTLSSSTRSDTNTSLITYTGTSEAGLIFTLNVNRALSDFWITLQRPDNQRQKMELTGSYLSGDVITIDTRPGSKSVSLLRSGFTSSILNNFDETGTWLSLMKGANQFGAFAAGAGVPFSMMYTTQFGAI